MTKRSDVKGGIFSPESSQRRESVTLGKGGSELLMRHQNKIQGDGTKKEGEVRESREN